MTIETMTGAKRAPDVVAIQSTGVPANDGRRSGIDGVVKTTTETIDMPAKADGVVNTAAHAPAANTEAVANQDTVVADPKVAKTTAAAVRKAAANTAATAADPVAIQAAATWVAAP
jgi:hypothetical protein